jgi:hypothetical protein
MGKSLSKFMSVVSAVCAFTVKILKLVVGDKAADVAKAEVCALAKEVRHLFVVHPHAATICVAPFAWKAFVITIAICIAVWAFESAKDAEPREHATAMLVAGVLQAS